VRCFSRSGRRVHLSHCQTFECLRLLSFHMNPEDLQKLATLAMPFGKHKGVLLADLPGNYLGWFAREGFPKGEMGRLLALMYELDHNGLRELLTPLRQGRP
jgi:uncharacterized protein